MAIFDINSHHQQQQYSSDNISFDSQQSTKLIFHKKLLWRKKSKLKDIIWENKDYQPKQSQIKIFHHAVHWKKESKLRITRLINWNIQEKTKHWSDIDLPQVTKNKALFAQYYEPKWNDIINTTNKIDSLIEEQEEELKLNDHIEENFNDGLQNKTQVQ
ncbi:unnamed protein product, partial [Rotaria sordida]